MSRRLSDDEKRVFSDQISLLKNENERLTDRIEELEEGIAKYEEPATCNRGHKTLPLKLWDCPECTAQLERKAALQERLIKRGIEYRAALEAESERLLGLIIRADEAGILTYDGDLSLSNDISDALLATEGSK